MRILTVLATTFGTLSACASAGAYPDDGLDVAPPPGVPASSVATTNSTQGASTGSGGASTPPDSMGAAGIAPLAAGSASAGASAATAGTAPTAGSTPIGGGATSGVGPPPPPPGPGSGGATGSGVPAGGGSPVGGTGAADPGPANQVGGCDSGMLPTVTDYSQNGPFQTQTINNSGPDGQYTIVKPATLGENGFRHPVATWGNGITTNPSFYPQLLGAIASHGFVIIASNSAAVNAQLMLAGLDWMVAQNDAAGEYQGKLNPACLVTVGYSLGGGGAVGAGVHANVVATVSLHGVRGSSNLLHSPLLLLTSENDVVCPPAVMVTPTFDASSVQTFYGTMSVAGDTSNLGHLIPVDGGLSLISQPAANLAERAATIAWLRLWVYGDQDARKYFYGDDCILCVAPWINPQRKHWQ